MGDENSKPIINVTVECEGENTVLCKPGGPLSIRGEIKVSGKQYRRTDISKLTVTLHQITRITFTDPPSGVKYGANGYHITKGILQLTEAGKWDPHNTTIGYLVVLENVTMPSHEDSNSRIRYVLHTEACCSRQQHSRKGPPITVSTPINVQFQQPPSILVDQSESDTESSDLPVYKAKYLQISGFPAYLCPGIRVSVLIRDDAPKDRKMARDVDTNKERKMAPLVRSVNLVQKRKYRGVSEGTFREKEKLSLKSKGVALLGNHSFGELISGWRLDLPLNLTSTFSDIEHMLDISYAIVITTLLDEIINIPVYMFYGSSANTGGSS